MTFAEDKTHFTLWSFVASPLIAGNDFRTMSKETLSILTNKDMIAVNQDKLGIQGFRYSADNGLEIWVKPLADGDWAVAFLNRGEGTKQVNFDWSKHTIKDDLNNLEANFGSTVYSIKDIWSNKEAGTTKKTFKAQVGPHDIVALKLTKKK